MPGRLQAVPDTPPAVLLYLRQSKKKEESISLEVQETACRDYCARKGYHVIGVIAEQKSGQLWSRRPGFQEVLRRVTAGEATRVVIYRWSRISRKRLHQALALATFDDAGAELESATEPFDTSTASGEFGRDQMLAFAHFQGRLIGEQWTEAHDNRRGRGLPHCGGKRWGYLYHGSHYEVDPAVRDSVEWAYREYIAGEGWISITRQLNDSGIPNAHGRPWHYTSLCDYLDSGFAAGWLGEGRGAQRRYRIRGSHEPIIDEETWETYLAARRVRGKKPGESNTARNPLASLVRCGDCGSAMVTAYGSRDKSGNYRLVYQCGKFRSTGIGRAVTIVRRRVQSALFDWLREAAADVEAAADEQPVRRRAQVRKSNDVKALAREIAAVDAQLKELTLQLARKVIPEVAYSAAVEELMQQRAALQDCLDAARLDAATERRPERDVAVRLLEHWDILPVRERRELLKQLVDRIVVTPNPRKHHRASVTVIPVWDAVAK